MFIDFHTHNLLDPTADQRLYCQYDLSKELPPELNSEKTKVCFGLHPWYLPNTIDEGMGLLEIWEQKTHTFGFGECGLDRLKGPDLSVQKEFLEAQLLWAQRKEKPFVVIHCVRAFPELMGVLKKNLFLGKVIIHDFRANNEITNQLLTFSQVSFSLGSLLKVSSLNDNQTKTINLIPLDRLFLETDDSQNQIREVYESFAKVRAIEISELSSQVQCNWNSLSS